MSESHPERRPYDPPMSPDQNYVEINAYVVGWGLFFAALFSLAVGYLCLKIGQTVDAFAPVSVLAMGMAVLFKRKNAFPETVHIQAIASAGTNIIGGVMFILPALFILQLNSQLTYTEMVIPIVLGGVLGVLLATTFRRYFCEEMDAAYPFPSGRAAAEVLSCNGGSKAHVMVFSGLLAMAYDFVLNTLGWWQEVLSTLTFSWGQAAAAKYKLAFSLDNDAALLGIGNGVSLIIFASIVSNWSSLYTSVKGLLTQAASGKPQYYFFLPLLIVLALVAVVFVVVMTNAERRITIQYAKRVVGRKQMGGQNSYLPLKLNMSGVMPIIFASALVSIPGTIGSFLQIDQQAHPVWYAFFHTFNYTSWLYVVIYLLLILAFNYFYVAIQYNPVEIANNLRRNNGSIPGFRPGKPTSDFITRTLNKITLIGAIFLAAVAVLPIILGNLTGMSIQLGGTSLLIVVGVALDTTRSLDSFMTMRNHKGFLG